MASTKCRRCGQPGGFYGNGLCGGCANEASAEKQYREQALRIEKEKLRELQRGGQGSAPSFGDGSFSSPGAGIALQAIGFIFGFLGMCSAWIAFCNHYKIPTGDGSPLQTSALIIFLVIAAIFRKTFGKAAIFLFVIAVIVFIVAVVLKTQKGS
jgi:hypothetical protein